MQLSVASTEVLIPFHRGLLSSGTHAMAHLSKGIQPQRSRLIALPGMWCAMETLSSALVTSRICWLIHIGHFIYPECCLRKAWQQIWAMHMLRVCSNFGVGFTYILNIPFSIDIEQTFMRLDGSKLLWKSLSATVANRAELTIADCIIQPNGPRNHWHPPAKEI